MNILIVEDEKLIAQMIKRGLRSPKQKITVAHDGESALNLALNEDFDLLIIDIMLPKMDGRALLKEVRRVKPEVPAIMLTARDDLESKVKSFEEGADDYVTKPFALKELRARVKAQLRRRQEWQSHILKMGNLTLDLRTRSAQLGNRDIPLTEREFALLEFFINHPNQVFSREELLSKVWPDEFDAQSNIVDVYVSFLRQKLNKGGKKPAIQTVRGVGYRLGL